LGPGAYDPDYTKLKKAAPIIDWAARKAARFDAKETQSPKNASKEALPGPGQYDVGVATGLIGANAVKERVEDVEKRKKQNSFANCKLIQQKIYAERFNIAEKKSRHIDTKKDAGARVGPGTYINPKVHSEFRPENKPEYLQFFGSTEERFKGSIGASTGAI